LQILTCDSRHPVNGSSTQPRQFENHATWSHFPKVASDSAAKRYNNARPRFDDQQQEADKKMKKTVMLMVAGLVTGVPAFAAQPREPHNWYVLSVWPESL
jgi:hypothetical protein